MNGQIEIMERQALNELAYKTTADLLQDLKGCFAITAYSVAHAARIWAELERRNYDLSEFKQTLKQYLPLVAAGRLVPEAVVEFMGDARRLRLFSAVPVPMQRSLLEKGSVEFVETAADGKHISRQVKIAALSLEEAKQVFDPDTGAVRSAADQAKILDRDQKPAFRKVGVNGSLKVSLATAGRVRRLADDRSLSVEDFIVWLMGKANV